MNKGMSSFADAINIVIRIIIDCKYVIHGIFSAFITLFNPSCPMKKYINSNDMLGKVNINATEIDKNKKEIVDAKSAALTSIIDVNKLNIPISFKYDHKTKQPINR
ncbi:hypothetical protein H0249_07100 [Pectobacterium brasiliense]|uniref:hypothetical protein n=1 Tax=Pectobacterium brasiliense TaxID=180957 RepID=UPI00183D4672|nr:hypothetical protein [Pectobacterium brasiliense]MBA0196281.1 hypothetical protein [Pectobacterium brasiliense]